MKVEQLQRARYQGIEQQPSPRPGRDVDANAFGKVLAEEMGGRTQQVKFSAHAADRLATRNIMLTDGDLMRLSQAVDKMQEKGGKESLLLMGDLAFVVSVANKTVITAMDKNLGLSDKVFTNIDSALIM